MSGSKTPVTRVPLDRLARWRLARRRAKLTRNRRPLSRATLVLVATLVVLLGLVVAAFAFLSPTRSGRQASLDEVLALASQRRIATAIFLDEDASLNVVVAAQPRQATPGAGLVAPSAAPSSPVAAPALPLGAAARLWVAYPRDNSLTSQLITDLTTGGSRVRVDPQSTKAAVRLLLTVLLPLMILANLFALFFTAGRGGGTLGDVVSFGRIKGKRFSRRTGGGTTFADVAGLEEAIVELGEVVDYLRSPQRYQEMAAAPPKGVLLFGPPGCGKTLLARAVAGEAEVPFFNVAGAEFVEALVGVGAARVRDLFARVRQVAPAIVFIDELDAAGRRRSAEGGGSEERDQTLNQLLVEMDGFDVASGVVVIAATNRTDILDPALLRPGRFDRHMIIERPDLERREAILRLHASRRPTAAELDFGVLARLTPGFSGADLANVINEAALLTLRADGNVIGWDALSEAVQRVTSGPQRRGHVLTADERRRLASHEAGHAVVASLTGREVNRVSIVARRGGLGAVGVDGREEEVVAARSLLLSQLVTQLAGRAAEELIFGEASTGAEDDIEAASGLARDIAGRWGMVDEIGVVRLLLPDRDAALDDAARLGPMAPDTHAQFDTAVRRLMETALVDATRLIEAHRPVLDALVIRLLDEETLEGQRLHELLPGVNPGPWPLPVLDVTGSARPTAAPSLSGSKMATV